MKIICIGRNYGEHARELNNEIPEEPVIFMKPDTALLRNNEPFFLPAFSSDVHHEIEVVLRIGKAGKKIAEKFAMKYVESITLGIDFTARDKQSYLKGKGLPWELAKGFDGSAVVGDLVKVYDIPDPADISFSLQKNGQVVQQGNTQDMLHSFEKIISFVSDYFTLKTGDFIFTGTPKGVGPVQAGDRLEGFLGEKSLFRTEVK